MSEEIKERARVAATRMLGTLPGCTTCVEAAGIIARLTRERDEARRDLQFYKDREAHYARVLGVDDGGRFRADWDGAIDRLVRRATAAEAKVAYLEPHLDHVCRLHARAEARVRELEERIVALEAQLTTRGACECGADDVCALVRRAQEAERELDRVRVDLVTAQHAIGEGWFAGGADTATAIERKARALEDGARDAGARAAAAEERVREVEEALRGLLLSRDASWTGGHDWQDAVDRAAALLIPTTPTAGAVERKLCGRPIDDEHGNPTDQPCGFTRPCIYHDAPKAKSHYGWPNPPTPAPEQAGEGERCPHACIDEHEQPTDESCPFSKPCPVHDAREVRRG